MTNVMLTSCDRCHTRETAVPGFTLPAGWVGIDIRTDTNTDGAVRAATDRHKHVDLCTRCGGPVLAALESPK